MQGPSHGSWASDTRDPRVQAGRLLQLRFHWGSKMVAVRGLMGTLGCYEGAVVVVLDSLENVWS